MKQGDKLITTGLNMQCRKVLTTAVVIEAVDSELLIETEGLRMRVPRDRDYLLDTTKNRKLLREQIRALNS